MRERAGRASVGSPLLALRDAVLAATRPLLKGMPGAVEAADGAGVRAEIARLASLADRGGSSRAVSEARRLRWVLARR